MGGCGTHHATQLFILVPELLLSRFMIHGPFTKQGASAEPAHIRQLLKQTTPPVVIQRLELRIVALGDRVRGDLHSPKRR